MIFHRGALMGAAFFLAASCNFGITNNASVQIPGDLSPDEKVELAKSIAADVWDAGLKRSVLEEFDSVSESDLSQFGIRWHVMKSRSLAADDPGTRTFVHIQCSLRHRGGVAQAQEIVDFCKRKVREAMQRRGIETPAA